MKMENLVKIKEYDTYILYMHKDTGIRECFMKTDLIKSKNRKRNYISKYEK